jgi:septal ring factor EnvC (AmiA/AmiB activator)
MFLFSAEHFREAYLRYRLFKEYSRYRQKQGEILIESQNKVRGLVSQIKLQKNEKQAVLDNIEKEISALQNSRSRKNNVVTKLQKEEQWLQRTLKEKEAIAHELDQKIMDLIAADKNKSVDAVESADFAERMGQLMWPIQKGVVINSFGKHAHPVLSKVTINNNGVDIQASNRVDVFCVHSGVVSTIVGIPGLNKAVIVRHGKFLTVYANLVSVSVSKGDLIDAGQVVGRISQESGDMQNVLHFEIWEENRKLDPEQWMKH